MVSRIRSVEFFVDKIVITHFVCSFFSNPDCRFLASASKVSVLF